MKKKLALIATLVALSAAHADTITSASGSLTLVGKKPDGSTTGQAVIDGNGFMSIKGITGTGVDNLNISGNGRDVNLIASTGRVVTLGNANVTVDSSGYLTSWKGATFGGKVNAGTGVISATSSELINGSQLYTTNNNITSLTSTVSANKVAAANDASAKANTALTNANTYTDSKVTATQTIITNEVTRVDGRIDGVTASVEATNATVAANKATAASESTSKANAALASANTYTDNQVATVNANTTAQVNEARVEAHREVSNERDRAMAAEQALGKEIKQVGAMAMAAAGAAGATPVGDKKTALTTAIGSYSGQSAIAVGVTHLVKENIKAFGSVSSVIGGKAGVTVGASYSF